MTDIETVIRSGLDLRYPLPMRDPNWDGVLQRVAQAEEHGGARRASVRTKRRVWRRVAFVAATLVALTVALVLASPWSGGPSFLEQARAALGDGRYVHAVFQTSLSSVRVVDLATGRTRPVVRRVEWLYDTKTGAFDAHIVDDGVAFLSGGGTTPDPAVTRFASGYRNALTSGEARVIDQTTVNGQKAEVIRFSIRDSNGIVIFDEDVVVANSSHQPLLIRYRGVDRNGRPLGRTLTYEVVSIGSSDARPTLPPALVGPSLTGSATDIRRLEPAAAATVLGRAALWPGRTIGGVTLQRIFLQRVTTELVTGFQVTSSTAGLRLDYRGAKTTLDIEEATRWERGYGFWSASVGTGGPVPSSGKASLLCGTCGAANPPTSAPVWQVQLRKSGLFLTIHSSSRSLVIAAARALVPIP